MSCRAGSGLGLFKRDDITVPEGFGQILAQPADRESGDDLTPSASVAGCRGVARGRRLRTLPHRHAHVNGIVVLLT